MLLPVDLMTLVSAGSPSANLRDAGGTDADASASWLLAADANGLVESDNDMINKIFMSYASDGVADPAARFAHDLKALLSANGVSFSTGQTLLPSSDGMTAWPQIGEPGELAWSVDELLQMAVNPSSGGNNLPLNDQTLPSELSNWLAALIAPAAGDGPATESMPVSAGPSTAALTGDAVTAGSTATSPLSHGTPLMTAVAGVVATLAQARSSSSGAQASAMPDGLSTATGVPLSGGAAKLQLATAGSPVAGTKDKNYGIIPDGLVTKVLNGVSEFLTTSDQLKPPAITNKTSNFIADKVGNSAHFQPGSAEIQVAGVTAQSQMPLPETVLQPPLPAEATRQASETTQIHPASQKIAADAANASAFRSVQANQSVAGDIIGHADDMPASQPDLIRVSGLTERNQAMAAQLAGSLTAAINAESQASSASPQAPNQTDPGTLMNRPEPRMFSPDNMQQAQSQAAQQSVARTADGLPRFVMDTAFGQQGWSDSLSRQLMVMSSQGVSSAQIQLDPPELGSLMVKIQVSADQQTNVSFVSQHAVVREALEQQLNRLQDLFRDQGLNLQDVSVSDQSPQQREGESGGQQGQRRDSGTTEQDPASAEPVMMRSESLIDFYA